MIRIFDHPFLVFFIFLFAQWAAAYVGGFLRRRRPLGSEERADFDTVLTATLTLLALIIGFSFSMAVGRYDQRKNYEEAEANAIGTEFLRADLLPADDAMKVRELLRRYVDQRILFYGGDQPVATGEASDAQKVQDELWMSVARAATAQPNPVAALAVSGMNDVLNSQGYTQAAWSNRIPAAAWTLMALMAIVSNVLLGYRERSRGLLVLSVVPVVASIAFFLIADIDSPRGGVIRVTPNNLNAISQAMSARR
jgi:hypothetical protein